MYSTKRPIIDHKNKGYSAAKFVLIGKPNNLKVLGAKK
jgi:hypothetical protein